MDCFSALIVASFVFGLMTYGIVLMVQHDYRKERDQIQIERDELSRLLDRANRSMSEVATERRAVAKSLGDLIVEHTAVRNERDEAISERNDAVDQREKAKKERDEANQTIADIMSDISIVRMERQGVIEELEKITKERNELKNELGQCHAEYDQFIVNHHVMVGKLKSILTDAKSEIQ